jgi:ATP/maltotriose-dependent transcriptional regulator MalT
VTASPEPSVDRTYDPAVPGRAVSPVFIGRSDQLARAELVLDRVVERDSTHLLVAGEAGVGKSRFVREIAGRASERGFRILEGGCVAIGGMGLPFAPIASALRDDLGADDRGALLDLDSRSFDALAALVPGLAGIVGPDRDDAPRRAATDARPFGAATSDTGLFDAFVRLFRRLAADRPLLLVIEDIHWADPATRDAITWLVPGLADERVVLCLTYRTDELDRRHPLLPWLAEIGRTGRFERLDLARFDRDDTARIVEAIHGEPMDWARLNRLHERTDGNAFFLEELLLAEAADPAAAGLPPTITATLIARIAAAPDHVQRVLRVAAVAGRRVDHELIAEVSGLSEQDLTDGLRVAIDRQLLVRDGSGEAAGYAFRHALVREAAYDDVLPGERRALHRAYAEALDHRPAPSGASGAGHWVELAHHWGEARDDDRAAVAAIRAGDAAFEACAFTTAQRQYEKALGLWDSVTDPETSLGLDRVELLERAAGAAEIAGEFHRMADLLREAIAIQDVVADPVRGALIRAQLGRAYWLDEGPEPSLRLFEEAMALLPAGEATAERARVLAGVGQILMLVDRNDEAIAHCREAVRIARAVGARRIEGHAMNTLGVGLTALGQCVEGLARLEEALAIAEEVGSAEEVSRGYINLSDGLSLCGLDAQAATRVTEGIAAIDRLGATGSFGPLIRDNGSLIHYRLGQWEIAESMRLESARMLRPGRNAPVYHLTHTINLSVGRGDPDAGDRLDRVWQLLVGQPVEGQYHGEYVIARAAHQLWGREPRDAVRTVDEVTSLLEAHPLPHFLALAHAMGARANADRAELARAERHPEEVAEALARIDAHVARLAALLDAAPDDRDGQAELIASLRTAEAERSRAAGRSDPAAWQLAVEEWTSRDRAYEAALARWRLAEARLAGGDRPGGAVALLDAHAWAVDNGARPLLAELTALARRSRIDLAAGVAAGQEPSATVEPDRFGLTRREREVLELVADGLSNRQIAERLFISENTAGVHVSNIIGKLGASGRVEAAAIAHRSGLISVHAES